MWCTRASWPLAASTAAQRTSAYSPGAQRMSARCSRHTSRRRRPRRSSSRRPRPSVVTRNASSSESERRCHSCTRRRRTRARALRHRSGGVARLTFANSRMSALRTCDRRSPTTDVIGASTSRSPMRLGVEPRRCPSIIENVRGWSSAPARRCTSPSIGHRRRAGLTNGAQSGALGTTAASPTSVEGHRRRRPACERSSASRERSAAVAGVQQLIDTLCCFAVEGEDAVSAVMANRALRDALHQHGRSRRAARSPGS
jgi:hypothetical protein